MQNYVLCIYKDGYYVLKKQLIKGLGVIQIYLYKKKKILQIQIVEQILYGFAITGHTIYTCVSGDMLID